MTTRRPNPKHRPPAEVPEKTRRRLTVLSPAHEPVVDTRIRLLNELAGRTATFTMPPLASKQPLPRLVLDAPVTASGRKVRDVGFLSHTSKMACASFSLPAGPPSGGGTCPSSANIPDGSDAKEWVCHGCYAVTGRFFMSSVQIGQVVRLMWVKEALKAGHFVEDMVAAITRQRLYPCKRQGIINPDFFRIHDSGDFFSTAYLRAWEEVAARLPGVKFWAPTREWVFSAKLPTMRAAPPNLIIRPSALFVDELPPVVPGLPAGSSVMRAPPSVVWDCPAYNSEGKSCESSGCRNCWTHPERAVNYSPHGSIKSYRPGEKPLRSKKPRDNPGRASLSTVWGAHVSRSGRAWSRPQLPSIHNFWVTLDQLGHRASDFPERDWGDLFRSQGIRDAVEQDELLEGIMLSLG